MVRNSVVIPGDCNCCNKIAMGNQVSVEHPQPLTRGGTLVEWEEYMNQGKTKCEYELIVESTIAEKVNETKAEIIEINNNFVTKKKQAVLIQDIDFSRSLNELIVELVQLSRSEIHNWYARYNANRHANTFYPN